MNKIWLILFFSLLLRENFFSQWELKTNGLPSEWSTADPLAISNDSALVAFVRTSELPRPISISRDLANSWINHNTTYQWDGIDISILDKNTIWFCTGDGKIYHSNDGGKNWVLQFEDTLSASYLNFIKFFDKNNGIVVGDANSNTSPTIILKTTDGGMSWLYINDGSLIGEYSRDSFFCIEFPSPDVGYYSGSFRGLYKTINGGVTWTRILMPDGVQKVFMIKFYDENLGMLFEDKSFLEDHIYRTTDGGNSWEKLTLLTNTVHHDIEFVPGNPSNVWMTDYENVYFSGDTGTTWQEVNVSDQYLGARNIEFLNDSTGFIVCDNGKFYATYNKSGIVTSYSEKERVIINDYYIAQNYPNPFNPITIIKYEMPVEGFVTIKVYDILGNEITTLINEKKNSGRYEVTFNGKGLASGMYVYKIDVKSMNANYNDYSSVQKMLLIK